MYVRCVKKKDPYEVSLGYFSILTDPAGGYPAACHKRVHRLKIRWLTKPPYLSIKSGAIVLSRFAACWLGCRKEFISWLTAANRHSPAAKKEYAHCLASRSFAEWCQLVALGDGFSIHNFQVLLFFYIDLKCSTSFDTQWRSRPPYWKLTSFVTPRWCP